jgi:hypothetical protein
MSLKLCDHLFTGPFEIDSAEVRANQPPVVYAIVAKGGASWAPTFRIVDVGTSPEEGVCFSKHQRRSEWIAAASETIGIYYFYAPRSKFADTDRQRLAAALRAQYDPPRGFV